MHHQQIGEKDEIQEIEERISGAEDTVADADTAVKDNLKQKKNLLTENIQEIQDTLIRRNLRIEESEYSLLKGPRNVFNKIIEKNSPT